MSEEQSLPEHSVETIHPFKKVAQKILSLAILCILFATIIAGTSENFHSKMLSVGANVWDDYFILRGDEPVAECELNIDTDSRLSELAKEHELENADFDLFESEFERHNKKPQHHAIVQHGTSSNEIDTTRRRQ